MNRENRIWVILVLIGAALLAVRWFALPQGFGKAYVMEAPAAVDEQNPEGRWSIYETSTQREYAAAQAADPNQTTYRVSLMRSIGIWVAALFTLFVLSFVIKDNPLYKLAEAIFVGVSAAYWMVIGFWDTIIPNLIGKLSPELIRNWSMPGLGESEHSELFYIIPLLLGVMLLMRLSPKGAWISRWPMAFIIGVFCGLRLVTFIHADFLTQIRNTIVPVVVMTQHTGGVELIGPDGQPIPGFDLWQSLRHLILVVGVFACLVYFFFSVEHRGVVGKTAKLGIWFLMITFGAAFGYTVMGRIALLAIRIEFLFDDWLWLIDPTNRRVVDAVTNMLWMHAMPLLC